MKCRYPDVFCAAILNAQPMGFYAPAQLVRDAREHGVELREVDVNFSEWDSTLEDHHLPLVGRGGRARLTSPLRGGDAGEGQRGDFIAGTLTSPIPATPALPRKGEGVLPASFIPATPPRPPPSAPRMPCGSASARSRAFARRTPAAHRRARRWLHQRARPLASLRHFARRLERLAEADAFRSIGLDRRAALWEVRALDPLSAGGRACRSSPPPRLTDLQEEPDVACP